MKAVKPDDFNAYREAMNEKIMALPTIKLLSGFLILTPMHTAPEHWTKKPKKC